MVLFLLNLRMFSIYFINVKNRRTFYKIHVSTIRKQQHNVNKKQITTYLEIQQRLKIADMNEKCQYKTKHLQNNMAKKQQKIRQKQNQCKYSYQYQWILQQTQKRRHSFPILQFQNQYQIKILSQMKSSAGSLSHAAEDSKTNQGSKFKKNGRANQSSLNHLSRTYIQEVAPGKISLAKYEEQFQFDCKKILHLWLIGILPGPKYLGLTYDMQKKKIKGIQGSCISKLSECRIFLQKKKMKLIVTQTELNINQKMYMEARLDIKIFQRPQIKAASEDLIKNEHLYELKKQIDKILAEKNVYLISIFKKDEEYFNEVFQYVDSQEITRTDIRLAKGEGSKQEQTRRNGRNERNERNERNGRNGKNKNQKEPKKQYKSREQLYGKVTVSREHSQSSGKSDNSDYNQDTSAKWSQFKNQQYSQEQEQEQEQNQQQEVLETYHKLSKQSNKSSKQSTTITPTPPTIKPAIKILNQSFPAQILNVKQLKKWIQKQKHLDIQQFTFKLNIENDKQYVQIQLITDKKGDKKINVLNFYLSFSKYLLVSVKYDNVFQYCVGKMGQMCGKRGVEHKLYEGYAKSQIQQYQILQQFKQKKLQPNKSPSHSKKVKILILKGIKPNVEQTFDEITQFLQQNSKDPILKYNLYIDIPQIRSYLTEIKLIQSLKETIQEIVERICGDYDVVIERVREEMGKIEVRVRVEKNYYKGFVQQHQQKLLTQLKDSIHIQQEIIEKQELTPQLAQKYLLFNSCTCPGKIALIQTKRGHWVKTTKQIMEALNKMDTYSQKIKTSRLPMIEGLFQQLENQRVKVTNQRCNNNKMENIITLVGAKKDLNKATTLLKKHLKQLNSTLLDFHIPLTQNQTKVVQKNLKKFKQQLQQKWKTTLTFNKDMTINALITISSNSQPTINDPFVVYVMKYNMEYVPYGSIIFIKSKQELKMLDEEVFEMERGKLEKMGKKYVEDTRRMLKFVYREGSSSVSLAAQQAFFSSQLQYDSKEANFAFFMSSGNQSEYIIQLVKQLHLKMRYRNIKTRVFIFHSSSKSIQTTLKPLQLFQQSYLSRSKIEYYITDSSTNHYYSASGNRKIEQALKNGQKTIYLMGSDLNIKSEQATHLCSFKNQKMIHIATRIMTNLQIYPGKVQFQVDGYNKVFEIPVEEVKKVERQNNSEWVKISLSIYEIDLQKNTQTNIFTDYKRILRKKQTKQQNPFGSEYFNCTLNYKMDEIEITHWPKQQKNALKSIQLLKQLIEDKKITITHTFKNKISSQKFNKLKQFSRDYQVQIQWDGEKGVKVSGFEKVAVQLFGKNIDMLVVETREVMYPKYWESQKQQIQAFVVPSNSIQFNEVQALFKIRPIKQLLRIQNKLVYKKFYDERQSLISLNDGKPVKQMRLFHGTNSTDPKIIYQDKQQSFNINYTSDRNYLGKGTYFAEQAKYSISYQHKQILETGQIQCSMFLCLVLVGESQKFATQTQESKAMKDTNYKDPVKKLRYESSTLFTSGSNIYAVYKNRRAYPEYLIKY